MSLQADPTITMATVMGGRCARVGSRVKHYGQRWTGCATATVTGFCDIGHESPNHDGDTLASSWVKVLVTNDDAREDRRSVNGWDWDRTELAPDIPL